jgi:hypothetical protein
MKLSNAKSERFSKCWTKTGRMKGYKAEIVYHPDGFYFMLHKKSEDYIFNSLWKKMSYNSEEECLKACEDYITQLTNSKTQ